MKAIMKSAALLLSAALSAMPAQAAVVTKVYRFTVSDFQSVNSPATPPPQSIVTGQFTVTFDDAVETNNTSTGVTLNALNIALGSSLAVNYVPAVPGLGLRPTFQVGGSQGTVNVVTQNTNDFFLEFTDVLSAQPVFRSFFYAQQGTSAIFSGRTGSVTPVAATGVPEPATWLTMLLGFALAGATIRMRRSRVATA